MPAIGLESEFKVFVDDVEIVPQEYWRTPRAFISAPTLRRTAKSVQLSTGGALYFDGGVLEVVRDQLDAWERRTGTRVRLQAFSCHTNISFELGREDRDRNRTIQKLAVLLARVLNSRGIPLIAGVEPGRHPSRKGWITCDFHFPRNPFTGDIDSPEFPTTAGRTLSLRRIAFEIATHFRSTIERYADASSVRHLFSLLRGQTQSLLELDDRPAAYDDVGRETRTDPDGLTRSAYERVFLQLAARKPFHLAGEELVPVAVSGWYHAILRGPGGEERVVSIDQLLTVART